MVLEPPAKIGSMRQPEVTTADLVVLSMLATRPMHGYELNLELERCHVHDWAEISRPQVYYSLNKLAETKRVRLRKTKDRKQVYELTAAGRKALSEGLDSTEWATSRPPPPFITWLAMAQHTTKEAFQRVLDARIAFVGGELRREEETIVEVPIVRWMVEYAVRQFRMELEWLNELRADGSCNSG